MATRSSVEDSLPAIRSCDEVKLDLSSTTTTTTTTAESLFDVISRLPPSPSPTDVEDDFTIESSPLHPPSLAVAEDDLPLVFKQALVDPTFESEATSIPIPKGISLPDTPPSDRDSVDGLIDSDEIHFTALFRNVDEDEGTSLLEPVPFDASLRNLNVEEGTSLLEPLPFDASLSDLNEVDEVVESEEASEGASEGASYPDLVLDEIFDHLAFKDLLSCVQVCRQWRDKLYASSRWSSFQIGRCHLPIVHCIMLCK